MTFAVAGPAVKAAMVTSTPAVAIAEHPGKRHRVTDPKELELMLANFEDWWASGRSTPRGVVVSALTSHVRGAGFDSWPG